MRLQKHYACADPGEAEAAPRQDPSDNKVGNGDTKREQMSAVHAEAGPEVHVDKAAGIISITGLPLGCRCVTTPCLVYCHTACMHACI